METATTKPLGALLPGIVDTSIDATASLVKSTAPQDLMDLTNLPSRLDDTTLAMLQEVVNSPLPVAQRCGDDHFARCMKSLDILPRRADDSGGKLRYKLYQSKLGGYSEDALSFLVSKGLEEFHFFPTIAECLKVLAGFPNREVAGTRRETATHLIQRELNHRQDEAVQRLALRDVPQDEIDALPKRAKLVAVERGFLFALTDGRFVVRPDIAALSPDELDAHRAKVRGWVEEGLL